VSEHKPPPQNTWMNWILARVTPPARPCRPRNIRTTSPRHLYRKKLKTSLLGGALVNSRRISWWRKEGLVADRRESFRRCCYLRCLAIVSDKPALMIMYPELVQSARWLALRRRRLLNRFGSYQDAIDSRPQCPICWMEDELQADLLANPVQEEPNRHVCTLRGDHVFGF
jgi:hypothetical protein